MSDIKLKEIKPGMVIHCSKQEETDELFKMLRELGYTWYFGNDLKNTLRGFYHEDTCYCIEENLKITYSSMNFFKENKLEITEFSDLLDQELPVVESYHEKKEPEVKLQEAARPLVEYLRKNYHPHATAIVSLDYAEILEGKESAKYEEEM